jgi:UDP-N-acetylmuramyl pentapeptide phosphotransferase/UDP-N-acetylglucosamine-1-phosphate transferase
MPVVASVVSFVVAFIAIRVLLSRFGHLALDRPNERSLHEKPIPRTAGIAVLLGGALSLAFGAAELWAAFSLAGVLAAVSIADDMRGLPAWSRLLAHALAASVLVWYVLSPMDLVPMAVLIVAVVWITNLFNFMDGSDGLAGGMALIGFGAFGAAAWLAGERGVAAGCLALAGASAAFLLHNFHPARIFLGDVGAVPLGFLAAGLGLIGWRDDLWPLSFVALVFALFIGDATVTLVRRLLRRERVWQAHRDHYYQRMVRMGLGHRRTAWLAYAAMLVCAAAALVGRVQPPAVQAGIFAGVTVLLAAFAIWVDLRWARFQRAGPKPA